MTDENYDEFDEIAESLSRAILGDKYDSIDHADFEGTLSDFLGISTLEVEMGLSPGFFQNLAGEDDWSALIKLHALFEAAFSHLLTKHFGNPDLLEAFTHLELSDKKKGKLVFADKARLISKDVKRFVSTLSEVRNAFVHDVSNASTKLIDYVEGLPEGRRKGLKKAVTLSYDPDAELKILVDDEHYSYRAMVQLVAGVAFQYAPLASFWLTASYCLRETYTETRKSDIDHLKRDIRTEFFDVLIAANEEKKNA